MEVIIQNISNVPIQKENVYVDTERYSVLFYSAYQPMSTLQLSGKLYVYVDFTFMVRIDKDKNVWIVPRDLNG